MEKYSYYWCIVLFRRQPTFKSDTITGSKSKWNNKRDDHCNKSDFMPTITITI